MDGATAQALANQGYTVVGARENPKGRGHLNTVVSNFNVYDPSVGPLTSDVGLNHGDLRDAKTAFSGSLEGVKFYYDPNQDRSFIDESQILNTWNYPEGG